MTPLQGGSVALLSLVALIAYAVIGGLVALDARRRGVDRPAVWGLAVFGSMLLATLIVPTGTLGALLAGGLVIAFYILSTRR